MPLQVWTFTISWDVIYAPYNTVLYVKDNRWERVKTVK